MNDLLAGVAVSLVLVPQAMAYAELAGLPATVGLFAATVPLLLAAPLGSSPYLQTGPTAMTALLTFGALSTVSEPGADDYVRMAALLALIVGVVRLAMGLVHLGTMAYLMSQPVLLGFATGAATLIISSQLPTALGTHPPDGGVLNRAWWSLDHPGHWQTSAIVFAAVTVVIVVGGRKLHRMFPGVLVAVTIGIVVSRMTDYTGDTVGAVNASFPSLDLALPWSSLGSLLVTGTVIALVGFAEPTALARTFAAQERQRWDPDKELIGSGVANIGAALTGGMPVGGSFARSSLNHLAGAKTRWSGAFSGLTVLIFLPLAGVVYTLPRAVLAAIIITAGMNLVHYVSVIRISSYSRPQGLVAMVTVVATLATAPRVDRGILIGMTVSLIVHLWREIDVHSEIEHSEKSLLAKPRGVLWFGSSGRIADLLNNALAEHPDTETVVIDLAGAGRVDYSATLVIEQFLDDAESAGIEVFITNVSPGAEPLLRRKLGGRAGLPEWNAEQVDPPA